jgi:transposase
MPKPLSVDLRERAVNAYLTGSDRAEDVARRFNIGRATLVRWLSLKTTVGHVQPRKGRPGPKPVLDEADLDIVRDIVAKDPDLTIEEIAATFALRTERVISASTASRALAKLGMSRKKSP